MAGWKFYASAGWEFHGGSNFFSEVAFSRFPGAKRFRIGDPEKG